MAILFGSSVGIGMGRMALGRRLIREALHRDRTEWPGAAVGVNARATAVSRTATTSSARPTPTTTSGSGSPAASA